MTHTSYLRALGVGAGTILFAAIAGDARAGQAGVTSGACEAALCRAAGVKTPALIQIAPLDGRGITVCSCNFETTVCPTGEPVKSETTVPCLPQALDLPAEKADSLGASLTSQYCYPVVIGGTIKWKCVTLP
jgi:hypothetical protein